MNTEVNYTYATRVCSDNTPYTFATNTETGKESPYPVSVFHAEMEWANAETQTTCLRAGCDEMRKLTHTKHGNEIVYKGQKRQFLALCPFCQMDKSDHGKNYLKTDEYDAWKDGKEERTVVALRLKLQEAEGRLLKATQSKAERRAERKADAQVLGKSLNRARRSQ